MRKLVLMPDAPLKVTYLPAGRGSRLDSPTVAFGLIEASQARSADVAWSDLSPAEFSYLMAFWRTATHEGAERFLIDLPVRGPEPVEHVAAFSGGLQVSGVTGGSASVGGRIMFIPRLTVYPLSPARVDLVESIAEILP